MRAQAPGKLVLSGAYSVLSGAPALVAAVDRYVVADDTEPAQLETHEVKRAVALGYAARAVSFDASSLRTEGRKLGLGSSAAILVASMASLSHVPDDELADSLFLGALEAHQSAQGGGSGIDVAAACFGDVLQCSLRDDGGLEVLAHALPDGLAVDCWACPGAASTRDMLAAVRELAERDPAAHESCLARARTGAEAAASAADADELIAAIEAQRVALGELGKRAGVPIVTDEVAALAKLARRQGACFAPSGAGGGDVALLFRRSTSDTLVHEFRSRAERAGLFHVPMQVGAAGVHRLPGHSVTGDA